MAGSPAKSTYKWWETDDKTKRLYTELLAEKLRKSSPKKSSATLTRSLSSGSSFKTKNKEQEQGNVFGSPVRKLPLSRSTLHVEPPTANGSNPRKYTFETITMDTLAKYEYIKSPKKSPSHPMDLSSASSSDKPFEKKEILKQQENASTCQRNLGNVFHVKNIGREEDSITAMKKDIGKDNWKPLTPTKGTITGKGKITLASNSDNNSLTSIKTYSNTPTKASIGSLGTTSTYGTENWKKPSPWFMLMTASKTPELKTFGPSMTKDKSTSRKSEKVFTSLENKEKSCKMLTKLQEVPEYKSSASGDSSTEYSSDSSVDDNLMRAKAMGRLFKREGNDETKVDNNKDNTANDMKHQSQENTDGDLDVDQITKTFQTLCEDVEQLEFKMFEFSDDIHKLKMAIGIKENEQADANNPDKDVEYERTCDLTLDNKPRYKHTFTFAAGKDLLADRYTTRALLMRQHASPSKSPRAINKLLHDTGFDKGMAEADARKDKELEEQIKRINEKEMTEDEIQEVLRCAKAKYIDNPNYLEDIGHSGRNGRKKG